MSLTVIIPTLERESLRRAANSVARQTVFTEHIIMVDNGGWGAARTRNHAIAKVKTDWVGFLDDDDYLCSQYHEWLKEVTDADVVVFQMARPDGMVLPGHTDSDKLAYNWVGISFALKTTLARLFPFTDMIGEDYDLLNRLRQAKVRIRVLPQVAYFVGS